MNARSDTRLVPMTREFRDFLIDVVHMTEWESESTADMLIRHAYAWDAAPPDPADDVEVAIFAYDFPLRKRPWTVQEREEYAARAALVLRALGMPEVTA